MYSYQSFLEQVLVSGTLLFSFLSGVPQVIQGVFLSRLETLVSRKMAVFLLGLFFGSGVVKDTELASIFQQVGLSHVLSASGFNVHIVSKVLGADRLIMKKSWFISVWLMLGLLSFAWLAGFTPPVVRSVFQIKYALFARLSGRRLHPTLGVLVPSMMVLCLIPAWITSISFWLSVSASLGLSLENTRERIPIQKHFVRGVFSRLLEDFWVTVKASLFTVPIIAILFGRFSPVSFVANPLTLWTLRYWMVAGIGLFGLSFLQFPQISFLAGFTQIVLHNQFVFLEFLGNAPFSSLDLGRLRWTFGLCWIIGLCLVIFYRKNQSNHADKLRSQLRTNE